ncbi:MAG: EFR1 family ferrodoxin [Candidatus Omnitrophica bacterium]|nr:EFR1 family ferrodoxin [Candidatus Omnitrophota bacterium]
MKTTIFYFSGTGNCLKAARDLAGELGEAQIVNLAAVIDKELDLSAEAIGLVYPVYAFGMPLIVRRFIKKLKNGSDKYFFAIVTAGGFAADTLGQNARLFKSQGQKLAAGFFIRMPGNYTPFYEICSIDAQNKMFAQEGERIREIARMVKAKKPGKIERGNWLVNRFLSDMIYTLAAPLMPFEDKNFRADDKCNGCATCVRVCPVKNIRLADGKPQWLHRCEQCFACLHWCPQEAIQCGKNTSKRKRYHNPAVKLEDIIIA